MSMNALNTLSIKRSVSLTLSWRSVSRHVSSSGSSRGTGSSGNTTAPATVSKNKPMLTVAHINKRHLSPIIRKIHPDLFMSEDERIHKDNSVCLQTINELWSSIENTYKLLSNGHKNDICINAPFKQNYTFRCHIRVATDTNSTNSSNSAASVSADNSAAPTEECILKPVNVTITAPVELRVRGKSITSRKLNSSLWMILNQLGTFFQHTDTIDPWITATSDGTITGTHTDSNPVDVDMYNLTNYEKLIDERLLERNIQARHRVSLAINSINEFSRHHILFNNSSSSSGKSSGKSSKSSSSNGNIQLFDAEVAIFVYSKYNTYLKGIQKVEEENKIRGRLHAFLIEYGKLLNFRLDNWCNVTFILYKRKVTVDNYVSNRSSKKHPKLHFATDYRLSIVYKSSEKTKANTVYILEVPSTFTDKNLLEFLRINVPMTNYLYTKDAV